MVALRNPLTPQPQLRVPPGPRQLPARRLGQLVDLIGSVGFAQADDHVCDDVPGRVYDFFHV